MTGKTPDHDLDRPATDQPGRLWSMLNRRRRRGGSAPSPTGGSAPAPAPASGPAAALTDEQKAELAAAKAASVKAKAEAALATQAETEVLQSVGLKADDQLPGGVEQLAKDLSEKKNNEAQQRIRLTGGISWAVLVVGLIGAAVVLSGQVPDTNYDRFEIAKTTDYFAEAFWAAIAVLVIIAAISFFVGGVIRVLIGADGRFSTAYLQAYLWTVVLVWAFLFFLTVSLLGGNEGVEDAVDLATVTNGLGIEYLLLLGGPFAALIAAKQIYATKAQEGELQKIKTVDTSLTDVLTDDRGRADLVDLQYLLFNFVALAYFFVTFAESSAVLPTLPEGLIALTSTAALAYIGKKAVDRNKPVISSIALAAGTGTPTVGDLLRIRGLNFVPAGAEAEEYLRLVRVRFDKVETPVTPASAKAAKPGQPQLLAEANVTATEILVAVPPMELPSQRSVAVVVITAAGAETDSYQLYLAPKTINATFPDSITAGKIFRIGLDMPVGTPTHVEINSIAQSAVVLADKAISVVAPSGLSGTPTVALRADGYAEVKRLVAVH